MRFSKRTVAILASKPPLNGASANQMPALKTVAVAGGTTSDSAYTTAQLPANNTSGTSVSLISGLSSGVAYTIYIYGLGADETQTGCWSGTICETAIQSLQADSGATISAATLRPKRCVFFGDSYLSA